MASVSKRVRDALASVLSANFNSALETAAQTNGIAPFTMDFGSTSNQFFQGKVSVQAILEADNPVFPVCCLYTTLIQNHNVRAGYEKFRTFSGLVTVNMDWFLEHAEGNVSRDYETLADTLQDAILELMAPSSSAIATFLAAGIVWNGEMREARGQVVGDAGTGWLQPVNYQFNFEVHV